MKEEHMSPSPTLIPHANGRKKIKRCPDCGSDDLARIVYGYMEINDKIERDIARKKITLGGCCVGPYDWQCNNCGNSFE